jgi:DUF3102 family protein
MLLQRANIYRLESSEAQTLSELARRIDAEHGAVATALCSALAHAIAAGELLIEAKAKVRHGQWLKWIEANCSVPRRTAAHYMTLARARKDLCDQMGNVLPMSVNDALDQLKHPAERGFHGFSEWGDGKRTCSWGCFAWGEPFNHALKAVTFITDCNPPKPRYVVRAARAGKTPNLTVTALRAAIALLTRYADALENAQAGRRRIKDPLPSTEQR